MVAGSRLAVDPLFLSYVLAFTVAAVACFVGARRADRISDEDTRRGLVWLLLASGGWAGAHVGYLLAPSPVLKVSFYSAGLVIGIAAVGPWLYFCSAYTGRALHRNRTVRRVAVAGFVAIVLVKLTNPLHGLYFTAVLVSTPFPHLAVDLGLLHWVAMGLAYALAVGGYFMLFELFVQVGADARPLAAVAAVTGLPVILDIIAVLSPAVIDITYEPLGVAVFAIGVLVVYVERFQEVQLAGSRDEPSIVLSEDDRIRDYNRSARSLFPALHDRRVVGEPLWHVLPEIVDAFESAEPIIELDQEGETRYYRLDETPFTGGRANVGRVLTVTDVTHAERHRREIERQNERLESFASLVSHDLRNPLNVAMARVDAARDDGDVAHLEPAAAALGRMETLIEDLLTLARTGQPIDEATVMSLSAVAEESWALVETDDASLQIEADRRLRADPDRLRQLFENLFRNAVEHGGREVTVSVGATEDGFYVADDGPGIPAEDRDDVFESGFSTADEGTGFGLAIVAEIVEAHGWEIRVAESETGGARFEISEVGPVGADTEPQR